jgi:hypothetical protein
MYFSLSPSVLEVIQQKIISLLSERLNKQTNKQTTNSFDWIGERTITTERLPLVDEVSANFFRIEGATWPAWRISTAVVLAFLERSRYFFFQASPHLYSRGRVDTVPDPLLLTKCGSAGNRTRTSGSVAVEAAIWCHCFLVPPINHTPPATPNMERY